MRNILNNLILLLISSLWINISDADETTPHSPPAVEASAPVNAGEENAKALRTKAIEHWQAGEREQALTLLDQAIARFPQDACAPSTPNKTNARSPSSSASRGSIPSKRCARISNLLSNPPSRHFLRKMSRLIQIPEPISIDAIVRQVASLGRVNLPEPVV
ncbi:exported hypothetical protein [Gammaproteobacteria bacterium]